MKLKKLRTSIKSLLIVFGFACFALIVAGWFYWFQVRPSRIRKLCLAEAIESIELIEKSGKDARYIPATELNKPYRMCLVEHGMKPESIFIEKSKNQTLQKQPPIEIPDYVEQVVIEPEVEDAYRMQSFPKEELLSEKFERERQQKCQERINEYNMCMNEYNVEMAEYNECMAKAADPKSLESQGFGRYATMLCNKPRNFCFKPSCSY